MCEIEFSKLVTILEGIVDPKVEAIPLNVLTVVTGVAGSGKSPLVRDVFANAIYLQDTPIIPLSVLKFRHFHLAQTLILLLL